MFTNVAQQSTATTATATAVNYCLHNLAIIAKVVLFVDYALTIVSAHSVHTYQPSHFKSRHKGQVACYSCVAYTREMAIYKLMEVQPPSAQNISDLYDVLLKGGMRVPVYAERCAETRAGANPNFDGAHLSICPNTESEQGACVKLKGHFNGEAYVYRSCWSEMWLDARPYQRQMSERCFNDEMVQTFVATKRNTICFCEDDLCNRTSSPHLDFIFNCALFAHLMLLLIYFNVSII